MVDRDLNVEWSQSWVDLVLTKGPKGHGAEQHTSHSMKDDFDETVFQNNKR